MSFVLGDAGFILSTVSLSPDVGLMALISKQGVGGVYYEGEGMSRSNLPLKVLQVADADKAGLGTSQVGLHLDPLCPQGPPLQNNILLGPQQYVSSWPFSNFERVWAIVLHAFAVQVEALPKTFQGRRGPHELQENTQETA